jgi:succinate dehydrogenase flavin-adding protein (antitoxin of CptAB toxin-antitoxin module)
MNKKILIVLSNKFSTKELVEKAANELIMITNSIRVDYYFNDNNSYFIFDDDDLDYDMLWDCFIGWLVQDGVDYVLLSPNDRNVLHGLPQEVYSIVSDQNDGNTTNYINNKINHLNKTDEELINLIEFLDEEDDDIFKIKNRKKEKTVDEILDKISVNGIKSLTDDEIKILNKKSIKQ